MQLASTQCCENKQVLWSVMLYLAPGALRISGGVKRLAADFLTVSVKVPVTSRADMNASGRTRKR